MSINRNAQLRFRVLDKCLSNTGRQWTWKELLDKVNDALLEDNPISKGIGKTQLYEDLKDLEYRVYNAEIERTKKGRTTYLKYKDKNFSILNMPLTETETKQLKSAIHVLSRFKGMPQFEWVNEIIPALETKLGLVQIDKPIISFDDNVDYHGLGNITPIFNAIVNKRVLKVSYQDFKSPIPYDVILHPYYLKQFHNRWFVFGFNPAMENSFWNLALDRIKKIEEVTDNYKHSDIDWDEYFFDFIGVTKQSGEKLIEVKLHFSAAQAPYIVTKPLHPSQKHRNDESGLEVSIQVIPNFELEKLILSFGEDVKVLSPSSFRNKISERIKNSYLLYTQFT